MINLKLRLFFAAPLLLVLPAIASAVTIPTGLQLTPGKTTISVEWDANADSTTGYYVYWGLSAGALDTRYRMSGILSNSYSISGLSSGTTYYVAVSAFDAIGEGVLSDVLFTTTLTQSDISAPVGLRIDSIFGISTTTVGLRWDANTESNLDLYNIYYGTAPATYVTPLSTADGDTFFYNVTGLSPSTRYYMALTASDASGNESQKSAEIIVDTLPDSNAPTVPGKPAISITGNGEVEVAFNGNNDGMADLARYIVGYDTASLSYLSTADAGKMKSIRIGGLTTGMHYYFAVKAADASGNESAYSTEAAIFVEEISSYLGAMDAENLEEGCFIATAIFGSYDHPAVIILRQFRDGYLKGNSLGDKLIDFYYREGPGAAQWVKKSSLLRLASFILLLPLLIVAFILVKMGPMTTATFLLLPLIFRYRRGFGTLIIAALLLTPNVGQATDRHTFGIKLGHFTPADDRQSDYYEDKPLVSIFYDAKLHRYLSGEIEAGYLLRKGNALTISGNDTAIESELRMIPVAATLNLHIPLTDFIGIFAGAGPDYWYFKEKSDVSRKSLEVGGYHGKVGIVLKKYPNTLDNKYTKNFKLKIEAIRSKIDHFGDNDTDLGGWIYSAAASISF